MSSELAHRFESSLSAAREGVREVLTSHTLTGTARKRLEVEFDRRIKYLTKLSRALSDEEHEGELYRCLGYAWLELRSCWMCSNVTVQYAVFHTDVYDRETFVRAGACSYLLSVIEALLEPSDIEHLVHMTSEPFEHRV